MNIDIANGVMALRGLSQGFTSGFGFSCYYRRIGVSHNNYSLNLELPQTTYKEEYKYEKSGLTVALTWLLLFLLFSNL
ncbi:hypothetical protein [Orbus sasakiae]|uniref:hypothetical protein n=1 Tax=Orbus sasakiae TaxID=1078475 RepID=UPI0031EBAD8D